MVHGGGGTAKEAMRETGLTLKADQEGFLAGFPALGAGPLGPLSGLPLRVGSSCRFWLQRTDGR